MKNIVFLFAIFLIISCKSNDKKEIVEEVVTDTIQTPINILVPDEEDGGEMLLGIMDQKGLQLEQFKTWYDENHLAHEMDTTSIENIKPLLSSFSIKVFMGTWCEDSQKLVPALFKVLDVANYDSSQVEMIAVDHDKKTPDGLESGYDIEYVPTIIFSKNGKELNRIVEYEIETLEKDIFKIIDGQPYKNVYED
ncbi:MAG: thioredoxin family protein [Flavobacteriaceae bacterium]|nr:thioredoxin family protein [Flavobacteriaceae bacterium]